MGEYAVCIVLYLLVVACVIVSIAITAQAFKTRESLEKDIELSHWYINALIDKIETMPAETAIEILQIIDTRAKDICFDTNEEQDAVNHTVSELKQAITDKYGVECKNDN